MSNWLSKMLNLIFEDTINGEGRNNSHQRAPSPLTVVAGRIEDSNRSIKPKMVSQYPKEGTFRFPLIPDEKTPYPNTHNRHVKKDEEKREPKGISKSESEQRAIFSTDNFKPSEIPSPIYGFGERPEVFPPVYESASIKREPYNRQIESLSYQEGLETVKAPDVLAGGPNLKIREHQFGVDLSKTNDVASDTASDAAVPTKHRNLVEEEELPQSITSEEQKLPITKEATYKRQEEGQKSNQAVQEDKPSPSPVPEKKHHPDSQQKKGLIPFNVMMLQRDRDKIKQERRSPASSDDTQVVGQGYAYPTIQLLDKAEQRYDDDNNWLSQQKEMLQSTLDNFNVKATVIGATKGPSVTRIEVQPSPGVKVNKITNLSDDIKLSLAAKDIRMEAPIPGRNAIGIEVPNRISKPVSLRAIVTHPNFTKSSSPLSVALGLDISGKPVITDLQKMPHGLIAGATGSGKSVCLNSLLISILFKAHPDDVRLLLIDPKMVELAPYNNLPHLVTPVITDAKEATLGLKWAVEEMERRYELFAKTGARDIERYNKIRMEKGHSDQKMPYIVVVIDELADLMMVSPQDVEDAICRIAQKARACGMHLLLATQRPSVDVITGIIKANIPTRVAFAVSSQVDSRTIIDANGAEKLLGKGDMLFLGNGVSKPVRIQGNFVNDNEIERITDYVKKQKPPFYLFEKGELDQIAFSVDRDDEIFEDACEFVLGQGAASSSALQRRFRIGFNRAARLIEMMESRGFVSEAMGSKPRKVLVTKQEYINRLKEELQP